jgi:hypothetical protein
MQSQSSDTQRLDATSLRFEAVLREAGVSVAELQAQAMQERAEIVRERYGHLLSGPKSKRRK